MLNFDFYNPTRILFGADTIVKINDYVPAEARVLMLYGGESAVKMAH
jgi:NADP-dependent alcohol dehydrogenase